MDKKLNVKDFPSLDGVSLAPTKLLERLIEVYNKNVELDNDYALMANKAYEELESGKAKGLTEEEFYNALESVGL